MGYQKINEPLKLKDSIKIVIILAILAVGFGFSLKTLVEHENKQAAEIAIEEAAYIHPDTLFISKDLGDQSNLKVFIEKEHPQYEILEYKHVDSEYSAWNGVHNFYEFVLIKK